MHCNKIHNICLFSRYATPVEFGVEYRESVIMKLSPMTGRSGSGMASRSCRALMAAAFKFACVAEIKETQPWPSVCMVSIHFFSSVI